MSDSIRAFINFVKAQTESPVKMPGDLIRPVRVYLINLNYDEEQEEFFLGHIKIDKATDLCEIELHYLQHMIEFIQGVPQ